MAAASYYHQRNQAYIFYFSKRRQKSRFLHNLPDLKKIIVPAKQICLKAGLVQRITNLQLSFDLAQHFDFTKTGRDLVTCPGSHKLISDPAHPWTPVVFPGHHIRNSFFFRFFNTCHIFKSFILDSL